MLHITKRALVARGEREVSERGAHARDDTTQMGHATWRDELSRKLGLQARSSRYVGRESARAKAGVLYRRCSDDEATIYVATTW